MSPIVVQPVIGSMFMFTPRMASFTASYLLGRADRIPISNMGMSYASSNNIPVRNAQYPPSLNM